MELGPVDIGREQEVRKATIPLSHSLIVLVFYLLCCSRWAIGLEASTQIDQYGHTAWLTGRSGLNGPPRAIAQTSDGYIWIGTGNGIFRFDGVRFTRWANPESARLPSQNITYLFGAHDGSLYIGTELGLARLTNGHVFIYSEKPRSPGPFLEDAQGNLWMGHSSLSSASQVLCKVGDRSLDCHGDGLGCMRGNAVMSETAGSIWLGCDARISHWRQGRQPEIYSLPALKPLGMIHAMAVDQSGTLWAGATCVGSGCGLLKFADGQWKTYVTPQADGRRLFVQSLLSDSGNNLWIGTDRGLYKIDKGSLDHYDTTDGLTGKSVYQIFEDKERNLWVVTSAGVDMFRDLPVISFTARQGLADDNVSAIEVNPDGSVWIATPGIINVLRDQHFTRIKVPATGDAREISIIFRDSRNQMWVVIDGQVWRYREGRFDAVTGWKDRLLHNVVCITEDIHHQMWLVDHVPGTMHYALDRMEGLQVDETFPVDNHDGLFQIEPNSKGGLWVSGLLGGLFWFHNGILEPAHIENTDDKIQFMKADKDGSLWFGSLHHGLSRYQDGRTQSLTQEDGLPCDAGYDVADDGADSHWFYMQCGIIRIRNSELERRWLNSSYRVQPTVFNGYDDYKLESYQDEVAAYYTSGGRLWSVGGSGAQRIDPGHLPSNSVPPPVHIEHLFANHKEVVASARLELPVSPREIEIDYVGLSYTVPERVRFRYRLLGHSAAWTDAGTRRQAFYTDLGPGHYRFQVTASNNDGVWNDQGDVVDFTIPASWYQTMWFRLLCVILAVALAYIVYFLQIRRYAVAMRMRFNERLEERTRLARDLHDTLMQTIQGMKMVADHAKESVHDSVAAAAFASLMSEWSERASLEGRAALNSLRNSTTEENDLAAAFRRSFDTYIENDTTSVHLSLTGKSKEMHPIARDEVYRIGDEAIRNACLHSNGTRVDIELIYNENMLLRVRDNGEGIDPGTLQTGKAGHYGLTGMRERATRIGAKLAVSSSPQGTEIVLRVPGKAIYKSPAVRRLRRLVNRIARFAKGTSSKF